jgi:hypothetical protein
MSARVFWTDAFHHASILAPHLFPVRHVVFAGVMNAAIVSFAGFLGMDVG